MRKFLAIEALHTFCTPIYQRLQALWVFFIDHGVIYDGRDHFVWKRGEETLLLVPDEEGLKPVWRQETDGVGPEADCHA